MKPHLYIVRGVPGSGKSTFAEELKARGVVDEMWEMDMWRYDESGHYVHDRKKNPEIAAACFNQVKKDLLEGNNVAVANTFIFRKHVQPYVDLAAELGVACTVITMEGSYQNRHGVPGHFVQEMRKQMERWDGQ